MEHHSPSDTFREATDAASDAVSDTAATIKYRFKEGVTYASENIGKLGDALPRKETLAQVQSSFSDLLERQPLLLGAIGVAIGAAVAGAFRTSDLESELMGDLSDRVKEDLTARADAVSQSVRETSDTLAAEISDMAAESVERLQDTGRNAMDAARGKGEDVARTPRIRRNLHSRSSPPSERNKSRRLAANLI